MPPMTPCLKPLARALMLLGIACIWSQAAHADQAVQTDARRIQTLEKKLEDSNRLIEALSARLQALERAQPAAATPVNTADKDTARPALEQQVTQLQNSVSQLSESLSKVSSDTGLPVHGFADVGAGWSQGHDPIALHGFNGGTLDLYLTPQFGNRVKSLVELAVEYGQDGVVAIDMERLQLGYTVQDGLTVWAGRFHTPFGLWNTSFHHGANLQTSIYRPRMIDFEDKGGIVPAHSVGVWGSGKTDSTLGKVSYDLFVANGPSIHDRVLDFNAYTDRDGNKMAGFNLGLRPVGRLDGWTVGLHGFASTASTYDTSDALMNRSRLRMLGGYFAYDNDDWEAIGELYHFDNAGVSTPGKHQSNAWFMQLGKTYGLWTPYVRWEQAHLDVQDLYFSSQESGRPYDRLAGGLRYTIDAKASFKFELSTTREDDTTLIDASGALVPFTAVSYRRAALQYSVAF